MATRPTYELLIKENLFYGGCELCEEALARVTPEGYLRLLPDEELVIIPDYNVSGIMTGVHVELRHHSNPSVEAVN